MSPTKWCDCGKERASPSGSLLHHPEEKRPHVFKFLRIFLLDISKPSSSVPWIILKPQIMRGCTCMGTN